MIFHSYVSLPEGNRKTAFQGLLLWFQNLPATSYWTYRPISPPLAESSAVPKQLVKVKRLNSGKLLQSTQSLIRLVAWKHIIIVWIIFKIAWKVPKGYINKANDLNCCSKAPYCRKLRLPKNALRISAHICYATVPWVPSTGKMEKQNNHEPSLRNCMR